MWGPAIRGNTFDRIIYGDNAAAIGLAHGVTTSSWRTRHLRIRASVLKEALNATAAYPGERWKLLHLKGTELVADVAAQNLWQDKRFFRFVEDLGLKRQTLETPSLTSSSSDGAGGGSAAMRAMVLGGLLLATAEGRSDEEETEEDFSLIWMAGALLMTMGAIYMGQLVHAASKCCLKRLRVVEKGDEHRSERRRSESEKSSEQGDVVVVSEDERTDNGAGVSTESPSTQLSSGAHTTSDRMTSLSGPCSTGASSSAVGRGSDIIPPIRQGIPNPWNLFQHQNGGKGLTSSSLSKL